MAETTGVSPLELERAAAIDRLERFAARLEHVSVEAFRQVATDNPDTPERQARRTEAAGIAAAAGLDGVLDDALQRVRDYVLRAYSGSAYRPTWIGLNWGFSLGPTRDRVATIVAVQDAATAAVIEPLAPDELLDALRAPFELIAHGAVTRDGYETPSFRLGQIPGGPLMGIVALSSLLVSITGLLLIGAWPIIAVAIVGIVIAAGVLRRRPGA